MSAVQGVALDPQTRCVHWRGPLDVVAIEFACCGEFYACAECHADLAGHSPARWSEDDVDRRAVRCGVCDSTLSIGAYLAGTACPECGAPFNPRCALHRDRYFS